MRSTRTLFLSIFGVVIFLGIVAAFLLLHSPLPPAPAPLPTPNGYSTFVQIGHTIQKDTFDFPTMTPEQLRAVVEVNSNALQLVRSNLNQKSQVPLEYDAENMSTHLVDLSGLKALAQALSAEGKLAEMEQRPADAAKSYLATIQLGIQSQRGGTIIDALVGVAIEAMGTAHLQKIVNTLDAKTCQDLAQELETLNAQRQTWEQVLQQEHYWSRKSFPGLRYRIVALATSGSTKKLEAKTEQKFRSHEMDTKQLLISIAARAYELENGHRPASIADLVPTYLKAVPLDPFTNEKMIYSP